MKRFFLFSNGFGSDLPHAYQKGKNGLFMKNISPFKQFCMYDLKATLIFFSSVEMPFAYQFLRNTEKMKKVAGSSNVILRRC